MSTRSLAWIAVLFAVLLGLLGFVGAHRLGYWSQAEAPQWEFHNALLDCKPGTKTQVSPGRVDHARQRFWFLRVFREPEVDDVSVARSPVGRYAHVRAAISEQRPQEEGWYFQGPAVVAFRQLGALSSTEWLQEIGLVRERTDDGGTRELVAAQFANGAGAQMVYSYLPEESREEQARRGFGWTHLVRQARSVPAEVFFLESAGFQEPPAPK